MPRHKLPPELKPVPQSVRLTPETADRVCRLALRRGISVYSLLGGIIERVFAKHKTPTVGSPGYSEDQPSSTLRTVLGSPPAKGDRDADPSPPR